MQDGLVRRAVKRVALWNFVLNVSLARFLSRKRGERPYTLAGACRRCARCCEAPAIRVGPLLSRLPRTRGLFLAWQRIVNGFEFTRREGDTLVFRCTHFDWQTRSCDSYDSRPGICRDYPRALLDQPYPEFLPGCGYRPLAPNAAGLRRALEVVTKEQREALRKGLFLDE
jgi:hypothetical protein